MRSIRNNEAPPPAVPYRDVQHHVNNALTAIGGHAELALALLDEDGPGRADVRADLEAIAKAADGLASWVGSTGEGRITGSARP